MMSDTISEIFLPRARSPELCHQRDYNVNVGTMPAYSMPVPVKGFSSRLVTSATCFCKCCSRKWRPGGELSIQKDWCQLWAAAGGQDIKCQLSPWHLGLSRDLAVTLKHSRAAQKIDRIEISKGWTADSKRLSWNIEFSRESLMILAMTCRVMLEVVQIFLAFPWHRSLLVRCHVVYIWEW